MSCPLFEHSRSPSHSPGFRLHLLRQETTVILFSTPFVTGCGLLRIISVPDRRFRLIPAVSSDPWHARPFKPRRHPCLLTFLTANGFDSPYAFARHVTLFMRCTILAYFPGSVSFPTAYSVVWAAFDTKWHSLPPAMNIS